MKNCSRIHLIIILLVAVSSFLTVTTCRRSGYNRISDSSGSRLSVVRSEPAGIVRRASETDYPAEYRLQPEAGFNIIIPGKVKRAARFLPGKECTIRLGDALLVVPGDATQVEREFSVTGLMADDLPELPAEITNVTRGYYSGYRFLPHGMLFDSPATIEIAYDKNLIPPGYTEEDISTWYLDETDRKWKPLERLMINYELSTVVSGTLHFTDMINGIVRVPESPETEGFVPTSIKDIKAADPASEITLINPPEANSEGDARLSYTLKIPAGRSGINPRLQFLYSSDGGSGWAGLGWDISVPGISVDLSWGVPRYLADKESETYLYEGSQLAPVAHRDEYSDRKGEKRFYQRREGSYSRIIRHGDTPDNYWFEVTTKDGVSNYYGGLPGSGVLESNVSSDASGNIGFWALTETRDPHGNYIRYYYDKPAECGQQLYISEITYTGNGDEEGLYRVSFIRDDESNSYERKDININARYGFIQRDRELLRRIDITFDGENVRSYKLRFRDGKFSRTLLESIAECDAAGNEFYRHSFDYYDDISVNGENRPFEPEMSWELEDDNLKSPYLNPFLKNLSVLGASGSAGGSGSFAATVGIFDGKTYSKSCTAGGNVTYNGSTSEGFLALIDLNGDGLPDKVFKKDNKVYYRRNLLSYPGETMFADEKLIAGIKDFSVSKTTGYGGGVEAHPFIGFIGYNNAVSTTRTTVYFDDFNADGLIDLVDKNVVYFNHIDENGDPVFTATSELTPNPLYANSEIDLSILPDPAEEQARLEAQFPLHDAVRMWKAPFSGIIGIRDSIFLVQDTSITATEDSYKDGVKLSIQHNSNLLWSNEIDAGDYSVKYAGAGIGSVAVSRDDRLYFRVQSRFNGSYDMVHWDPEIEYYSINGSDTLTGLEDSNGKPVARYRASEDFALCGQQTVGLPDTGTIKIITSFSKPVTTDTLRVEITYTDNQGSCYSLFDHEYYPGQAVSDDSVTIERDVFDNEYIKFSAYSSTNIDWSSIKWSNYIEYTTLDDTVPPVGPDGKPLFSFIAVPEFSVMYNNPVRYEFPLVADSAFIRSLGIDSVDNQVHPIKITPKLIFRNIVNDTIILAIKTQNDILGEKRFHITGDTISGGDTLTAGIRLGDRLYFEFYFPDSTLARLNLGAEVVVGYDTLNPVRASVFSVINPHDLIFGHLYRGWGQFDYNGNDERRNALIDESLLFLSSKGNADVADMTDTTGLGDVQNPLGEVFNIMIPYGESKSYMGTDRQVYVQPGFISSSRLGEKNVQVDTFVFTASGLNAISKESRNSSNSVAAGGGIGIINGTASYSWGEGNLVIDMMDMNGDMYPDLLSSDNIQYTGVMGVLSGDPVNHSLGSHYSKSEAYGFTLGGTYVHAMQNNSGSGSAAKSVRSKTGNISKNNSNSELAQETSRASIGISGNFSTNSDYTDQTWLDINGDGLPDKVYNNGIVMLNLGYSFAPGEIWNFDAICNGESMDWGAGLGVNIDNGSIMGGIGFSMTENEASRTFMDINADGLPDMVSGSSVSFNSGNGFGPFIPWSGLGALDAGRSVGQSANAGFTVGITIPIVFIILKVCVNPSASITSGVSNTLTQLADINGDGMPDFLSSGKEDELIVRSSTIYRTNILKNVCSPLGAGFELDYLLTPAVYRHPGGKLALASVKLYDGLQGDGADTTFTSFEYEDGFYNRSERLFYGFGSVKTHFHPAVSDTLIYRTIEQEFNNSDYYRKGLMISETLTDSQGRNQKGSQYFYSLRDIHSGAELPPNYANSNRDPAFIALDESRDYSYMGSASPLIQTRVIYRYDTLGNIISFTDYSSGSAEDLYSVDIKYHSNHERYIYSIPSRQEVSTSQGISRINETDINDLGDITQIRKYITHGQYVNFDMEYDEYGNLTRIRRPANYKGERLWFGYIYDPVVHSYITEITDGYGYSSFSEYDYKWGQQLRVTDKNSQVTEYTYDDCGRMETIRGPWEIAAGKPYTLAFEYFPGAEVPYARTLHYDSVYNADIETYSFADGLGRGVQVKKTALLFENPATVERDGYIVSGKIKYDAFGRITEVYHPVFEPASYPSTYNPSQDNIQPNRVDYDLLDRILKITQPDGSVTTHSYNIGNCNGEAMFIDSLTDALNHTTVTYTKANGRKAAIIKKTLAGDAGTWFEYNGLGELLAVTDPVGNRTVSVYNMSGRPVSIDNPDGGITEFRYDGAGNITGKITANLRRQIPDNGMIKYNYDFERLTEIIYPRNIQNRVNFSYGEPGAPFNRAGRVTLVQDASGGQEFFYDRLGQVVKTIRTIQLGESDMRTWIWAASYDTWNRIHSMTYPDGEKVIYSYNRAGNLSKMEGEKLGRKYEYISRTGYDKFEKQVYLQYGNGSVTTFDFEPSRNRLTEMIISSNNILQVNNSYTYDALSNIVGTTITTQSNVKIGGDLIQSYSYDELNQLDHASGIFRGIRDTSNYTLDMRYDIAGRIIQKSQSHYSNGELLDPASLDFLYKYESSHPGAASNIGSRLVTFDDNGNQVSWDDSTTNDFRLLAWDEENRLTMISDNGYLSRYVYDASGERVIKSHGGIQGAYINGAPVGIINHSVNNYTIYVSPYFIFKNEGFTKHYYAGDTRVTSKIGNGVFQNQYRPGICEITAGGVNYINRQQQLMDSKTGYESQLKIAPGPPTLKGIYADPLFSGSGYPDPGTPDQAIPAGWPRQPLFAPAGGPPGAPIQWGDKITNNNVEPGFGFVGTGSIEELLGYFYHSNNLGSAIYLTNRRGEAIQFIAYMPFGETLAEQHSEWDSPYKFNARENDSETGLYYYGDRYYDPGTSLWLSVDPQAEETPGISPYTYCENNPVINYNWRSRSKVQDIRLFEDFLNSRERGGYRLDSNDSPGSPGGGSYGSQASQAGTDNSGSFTMPVGYTSDKIGGSSILKLDRKPTGKWIQKDGKWVKEKKWVVVKQYGGGKETETISSTKTAKINGEGSGKPKETFRQELIRTVKSRNAEKNKANQADPAKRQAEPPVKKKRSLSIK